MKTITQAKLMKLFKEAEGDWDMLLWLLKRYFKGEN